MGELDPVLSGLLGFLSRTLATPSESPEKMEAARSQLATSAGAAQRYPVMKPPGPYIGKAKSHASNSYCGEQTFSSSS